MNEVDILEQWLVERNPILMDMLLRDRTTGGRIKWATANYEEKGENYFPNKEITVASVSVVYADVIQPRATKKNDEKLRRTKDNAEVFTPSWTCNCQNNLIDAVWFGRENVFNTEFAGGWVTNEEKIEFPKNKIWKDYVMATRMEITCGEAPYLVSRYDAVTGEEIQVRDRIGLLDRKLRVINENVDNKREWYKWVKRAYKSVYGYDYQGDNVVLARENLLYTLIDIGYISYNFIKKNQDLVNKYNVFTARSNNLGTELNDDNLNAFLGEPNTVCSETYIVVNEGLDLDRDSCLNLCKYFRTKFVRYLHSLAKASQDATAKTFKYIPSQDFTNNSDIDWSKSIDEIDIQLYDKYKFTEDEKIYVNGLIKPM